MCEREQHIDNQLHLATGWLQWPRVERRSNRYGTVRLFEFPRERDTMVDYPSLPLGKYGRLVAEVIETQESSHVGDLFRGLQPQTPEVGERMVLGEDFI